MNEEILLLLPELDVPAEISRINYQIQVALEEEEEIIELLMDEDDDDEGRIGFKNYFEKTVPNYSNEQFLRNFRISRKLFDWLSTKYAESIFYRKIQHKFNVISAEKSVAIFLWFAGSKSKCYREISYLFDVSISSVHYAIRRISRFISSLSSDTIVWPNNAEMNQEAIKNENLSTIPGIIGFVNRTHIQIDPPKDKKDDYLNREGVVSMMAQAVCNSDYQFIQITVGFPGSVDDIQTYSISELPHLLTTKLGSESSNYFILGDCTYPCTAQLLTPYRDDGHLSASHKLFNSTLSSRHNTIHHAFTMLKKRFRQLYYCRIRGHENIIHFIRASFVLHNICLKDPDSIINELNENNDVAKRESNTFPNSPSDVEEMSNKDGKLLREDLRRTLFVEPISV